MLSNEEKKEIDKNILEFIQIFRKHEIELVCWGGTAVTIIRDKEFKYYKPFNNFFLDCNKYLAKILPEIKGNYLKKTSYFNSDLLKDLRNAKWKVKYTFSKIPEKGDNFIAFKFKNSKINHFIDFWSYVQLDNGVYFGIRDYCKIDPIFFKNPKSLFIEGVEIKIPDNTDLYLETNYGNWKKKENKIRPKGSVLLNKKTGNVDIIEIDNKKRELIFMSIYKDIINNFIFK